MSNALQKMLSAGALIGAICVMGAATVSAQSVQVAPGVAGTQQGYIDPYAAYAYTPRLRIEPSWEFSGSFDPRSGSRRYRELRVKPGAAVESCFLGRTVPDRC
ncbi:MAG TPA: hypothetical protein VH678_24910 [Xanthobacteraceae bacterium]|jgi:hypothetical protein